MTATNRDKSARTRVEVIAEARGCTPPVPCGRGAGANGSDLPCDCDAAAVTGRKIRVTTRVEILNVYEIDVDTLLADDYFEDVDLTSVEAVAVRIEDWLVDEPDKWSAPWARELAGLGEGSREVHEVELHPEKRAASTGGRDDG